MYRVPADDAAINHRFYQTSYRQGNTSQVPNSLDLERFLQSGFQDSDISYGYYISVLHELGLSEGARIFDYGCSWGYGSWQLMRAGYQVQACEISRPRAAFARENLGVDCAPDVCGKMFGGASRHSFDCFFSAHVLEHVPSPSQIIELARLALRPGGFFVAFTPNGSNAFRLVDATAWHRLWGQVHPNLIDDEFYCRAFASNPLYLDTSPADLDAVAGFATGEVTSNRVLAGSELLCIGRF
jgi:2-polyprenyl-3-methyl-5-hydroxy-6-metoxy-1,4-benzoquinol methylase